MRDGSSAASPTLRSRRPALPERAADLGPAALGQAAGASAKGEMIHSTRLALTDLLAGLSCWLLDLTVMQVGRTAFVVVYLNPNQPMDGAAIDLIRDRIEERCRELLQMPVRSEVILTATPPFSASSTS